MIFSVRIFFPIPFLSLNSFVFVPRLVKKKSGARQNSRSDNVFYFSTQRPWEKFKKCANNFLLIWKLITCTAGCKISYRKRKLETRIPGRTFFFLLDFVNRLYHCWYPLLSSQTTQKYRRISEINKNNYNWTATWSKFHLVTEAWEKTFC